MLSWEMEDDGAGEGRSSRGDRLPGRCQNTAKSRWEGERRKTSKGRKRAKTRLLHPPLYCPVPLHKRIPNISKTFSLPAPNVGRFPVFFSTSFSDDPTSAEMM